MAEGEGTTTSLWWDMESCPLPSYVDPYILVSMASALLRNFNINTSIVNDGGEPIGNHPFSAYDLFSETQTDLHQTLVNSGIGLHQLPPVTGRRKEMEKMMIADVLLWAMDTPPPANIIFIVGNVDLSYVFQKLRQRSYNVFLVCQSMNEIPQGMLGGVNDCLGWLLFLMALQNEVRHSHFPGGTTVYDTLSKTPFPTSPTSFHSKEMEKTNNAPSFNYSQNTLFSMKPSLGDEWDSTCNFPHLSAMDGMVHAIFHQMKRLEDQCSQSLVSMAVFLEQRSPGALYLQHRRLERRRNWLRCRISKHG